MPNISEIVAKFPANELTVHRLYTNSETFQAVCTDYLDAIKALKFWCSATPAANDKAEDYRKIVAELEKEITDIIEQAEYSDGHRQK